MSLRKITAGFAILAALVFVGCDDDSTSSTPAATKIDSGKWVPVSKIHTTITSSTTTMMGQTETERDTVTSTNQFNDTTEILVVTDNSMTYYADEVDSTVVITFSNDLEGELKKMVKTMSAAYLSELGNDAKVTKAEVTDFKSTVSGNNLIISYKLIIVLESTMDFLGTSVKVVGENIMETTDTFIAYEGDVPPSDWPTKQVNGTILDL